jgi:hypothetical protein
MKQARVNLADQWQNRPGPPSLESVALRAVFGGSALRRLKTNEDYWFRLPIPKA